MSLPVASLIERLMAAPAMPVADAGAILLDALSDGRLSPEDFLDDPKRLTQAPLGVSRYLAQVAWRALRGDYETLDEVVASLYGVLDRNPPTLEPRTEQVPGDPADRVVIPEARILGVDPPVTNEDGTWTVVFDAIVTSGELREREIRVTVDSRISAATARAVSAFWVHATVAMYNLAGDGHDRFATRADSFFVIEPLRQVNATAVARSMLCPKPRIDQIRRGRGDVTVHTLKGMVVHGMFDRLIAGESDVEDVYRGVVTSYRVQLAAIADASFDEDAFHTDAIRHGRALVEFLDRNPHMRRDPQVELRRYSATIGIQGRIDVVVRTGDRLDIVELKTGKRVRPEDHTQLFIYRLLLSDYVRRARARHEAEFELDSRILSSYDGTTTPLRIDADFHAVLETRNRLIAHSYALGRDRTHLRMPYAGYDPAVCDRCVSWTASQCREDSALFGDAAHGAAGDAPEWSPGTVPAADRESLQVAARAYFQTFTRRVQRESWQSGQELADLLDDSRLGYRIHNFRAIGAARCAGRHDGVFVFEFEENASDVGPGDAVLIHTGQISATMPFHGYVRSISRHSAHIAIPLHNLSDHTFGSDVWTIDRFPSDTTADASQTGLYDFLSSPPDERKRVLLGDVGVGTPTGDHAGPGEGSGDLNAAQVQAIDAALNAPVFHLIWGPPGTGKTRVVAEIVAHTVALDRVLDRGGVLLGAFTNTALDKMLMTLLDRDPAARFLRIGRSTGSPELAERLGDRAASSFSEDLAAGAKSAVALRRAMDGVHIVAATAHRASSHPYLRGRRFELTVVDEATQLTEPLTLGLVMRAARFVLIGDDRQLPPVVRSERLSVSMFERLKARVETDAPDRLTLLNVQYRMHPEIMGLSNRFFYGGRLASGVSAEDRTPPVGEPLEFVPVEEVSEGRSNLAEAHAVVFQVERLRKSVAPDAIGVISPFRAQVVLLRQMLASTGVAVDTVERFQGGERDVIVLSMVRSRGSGFVFDDRRFNVAITRARRKLIVVAHPELFRNTRYDALMDRSGPVELG